jgi:uncharacterized protein DUF397
MIQMLASQHQLTWKKSSYSAHQGACVEVAMVPAKLWRKSSKSGDTGGNCVEVATISPEVWRKSTHSADQGACVEVAFPEGAVAARDSKDPDGGVLLFGHRAWARFLAATARGAFDQR